MKNLNTIGTLVLLVLFTIEFLLTLLHKHEENKIQDMKTNLILGIMVFPVGILEKAISFAVYTLVYDFAIFRPGPSVWLWIAGFFACDFIQYVNHWLGHKVSFFWAAHVTHHSSEYYNFSTGFRQNAFQLCYQFLFFTPLCLFGIPPAMILTIKSIILIYTFFIHTEKIGKLGILDWIFNTPSNHRVHHASNPEYIDKNLGSLFMIYDHIFGTYARETVKPIYGITKKLDTHNPIKITTHEYQRLIEGFTRIKKWTAKFRFLFSLPS